MTRKVLVLESGTRGRSGDNRHSMEKGDGGRKRLKVRFIKKFLVFLMGKRFPRGTIENQSKETWGFFEKR